MVVAVVAVVTPVTGDGVRRLAGEAACTPPERAVDVALLPSECTLRAEGKWLLLDREVDPRCCWLFCLPTDPAPKTLSDARPDTADPAPPLLRLPLPGVPNAVKRPLVRALDDAEWLA